MITKLLNYFRTPITDNISYVEEDSSTKVINDIGEPVLSFVRCFKDNPKRFEIDTYINVVYIKDTKAKIVYRYEKSCDCNPPLYAHCWWSAPDYKSIVANKVISCAEYNYITDSINKHFEDREERLNELKILREQGEADKMRNELMEVYNGRFQSED
jgi:hypothetical protein